MIIAEIDTDGSGTVDFDGKSSKAINKPNNKHQGKDAL